MAFGKEDVTTQVMSAIWLALVSVLISCNPNLCLMIPSGMISFLIRSCIKLVVLASVSRHSSFSDENSPEKATINIYHYTNAILSCAYCIFGITCYYFSLASVETLMIISSGYHIHNLYDISRHRLYSNTKSGKVFLFQSCVLLILLVLAVNKRLDVQFQKLLVPVLLHSLLVSLKDIIVMKYPDSKLKSLGVFSMAAWITLLLGRLKLSFLHLLHVGEVEGLISAQGCVTIILFGLNVCVVILSIYSTMISIDTYKQPAFETAKETIAPNHWKIHGQCFDLTQFAAKHPGGKTALELGRGRDCTALFESYHPFTTKHLAILKKYASSEEQYQEALEKHKADKFYQTLRQRVKVLIEAKDMGIKASAGRKLYYLMMLSGFLTTYYFLYLGGYWYGPFLLASFGWLCGSFGHDGSHFAISTSPLINYLGNLGMAPITSPFIWLYQHTYAHHSFTNEFEHDPDLHHFSFLRAHHRYPWMKRYKSQSTRLYVYAWYIFVVLGSALWIPFKTMMSHTLHNITDLSMLKRRDWSRVIAHLVIFAWMIIVQPFFSLTFKSAVASSLSYLVVAGLYFGFFSQVNHLDDASIAAAEKKTSHSSWAAVQVEASNNFCTSSLFWTWLSNGLNFQIEHHLFPSINHEKLSMISPVVQKTCEEYGVDYQSYPTTRSILNATAKYYHSLASPFFTPQQQPPN